MTIWIVRNCDICGKLLAEGPYFPGYDFSNRDLCKGCALIRGEDVSKWY